MEYRYIYAVKKSMMASIVKLHHDVASIPIIQQNRFSIWFLKKTLPDLLPVQCYIV